MTQNINTIQTNFNLGVPHSELFEGEFEHFWKYVFPEIIKKANKDPFQVWDTKLTERSGDDELVLKNWLRSINFFAKYPELIMDRVWDTLEPVTYNKDQVVMGKGDESTFMIVIYSGTIGIFLQTVNELNGAPINHLKEAIVIIPNIGNNGKWIAKVGTEGVLGEAGLLKGACRGATWISLEKTKAMYLSSNNYVKIVESFHKSELFLNINFNKNLDFLKDVTFNKLEKLAASYNSRVFKKGNVVIEIGDLVSQLYILKSGKLKVEK